jgi:hypothetical protein
MEYSKLARKLASSSYSLMALAIGSGQEAAHLPQLQLCAPLSRLGLIQLGERASSLGHSLTADAVPSQIVMDLEENGGTAAADPSSRTVGPATGSVTLPFKFTVATQSGQRWSVDVSALVAGVKRSTCGGTQQFRIVAGNADVANAVLSGLGLTEAAAGVTSTVNLLITDQYGNGVAVPTTNISAILVPLARYLILIAPAPFSRLIRTVGIAHSTHFFQSHAHPGVRLCVFPAFGRVAVHNLRARSD